MKSKTLLHGAVLVGVLALAAGCKTAPQTLPDVASGSVENLVSGQPGLLGAPDPAAAAGLKVRLHVKPDPTPRFQVLALPAGWTEAIVSLVSPTVSAPYDAVHHSRRIPFADFTQDGGAGGAVASLVGGGVIDQPMGIAVDGPRVLVAGYGAADGNIHLIETDKNNQVTPWLTGLGSPSGIAVGNGRVAVTESNTSALHVYNATTKALIKTYADLGMPWDVAIDGTDMWVVDYGGATGRLLKVDTLNNDTVHTYASNLNMPMGISVSGTMVAVADFDGVHLYNKSGAHLRTIAMNSPNDVAIDGDIVYVTSGDYNYLKTIDTANDDAVATVPGITSLGAYGVTVSGGTLYTADFASGQGGVRALTLASAVTFTSTTEFPPLRPGADYEARVYLKHEGGTISTKRLAGSAVATGITLKAGANIIDLTVEANGQLSTSGMTSPAILLLGQPATLNTGVAAGQKGVSRVEISLSGPAYGDGSTPVLIDTLTNPGTWNHYVWNIDAGSGNYLPGLLKAGSGRIDTRAYNDRGEIVGHAAFNMTVVSLL